MQRSAILAAVQGRYGIPTDDGLLTPTVINGFIDRAVKKVELAHDWPWLETTETIATTNGTSVYSVASNYVRTISVRIEEAAPMTRFSIVEADHWGIANIGTPKAYALIGRQIRLIPTPNATLSVLHRYVRTETALGSDSAEPLCPEPWIEAVITWTGVLCADRTSNMEQHGARKVEFADIIGDLVRRSNEDADTTGGGAPAPVAPAKA